MCHCEDAYKDVGVTSPWMDEVDHVGNIWSRQRWEQAFEHSGLILCLCEERSDAAISSFDIGSNLIRVSEVTY